MQVDPVKEEMTPEELEIFRKRLGFEKDPVPYNEELMKRALEDPEVKHVRVFKADDLKKKKAARKKKRKAQRKARKKK